MQKISLIGFVTAMLAAIGILAVVPAQKPVTVRQAEHQPVPVEATRVAALNPAAPAPAEHRRTIPNDPALIAADLPSVARTMDVDTSDFADNRIRRVYAMTTTAVLRAQSKGRGPNQDPTVGRLAAVAELIQDGRIRYAGPPETAPDLQSTTETYFMSTQVDGLRLIFEIKRSEFPHAFG